MGTPLGRAGRHRRRAFEAKLLLVTRAADDDLDPYDLVGKLGTIRSATTAEPALRSFHGLIGCVVPKPPSTDLAAALEETQAVAMQRAVEWLAAESAALLVGSLIAEEALQTGDPERALLKAEEQPLARRALATLPEDERRAFEMCAAGAQTLPEIARERGRDERTVRRWRDAAARKLARAVTAG